MTALNTMSNQELVHSVLETERELVQARFAHSANQLDNTARLQELRRMLARIKTEVRSREIAASLPKDSLLQAHRGSFGVEAVAADEADEAPKGGFLKGFVDKISGSE